jgi:orotidine-5'-phosphate decarboxylase
MEYDARNRESREGRNDMNKIIFPRACWAIDDSNHEGAIKKAHMVEDIPGNFGIKVNIDLVVRGSEIITIIHNITRRPVFVDIKMNNGKRTMNELVLEVADCGGKMINAYVQADRLLEKAIQTARDNGIIFLGVTVTTHFNEDYCQKYYRRSLPETIKFLATEATNIGFDGIILPGTMLKYVPTYEGIRFIPATRPAWFADKKANDQEQECTPTDAVLPQDNEGNLVRGADTVSCGSPVFKSPDPREAAKLIMAEVDAAWAKRLSD